MPGDTPTYVGPDQWVKQVGERSDGSPLYQAGPRSGKYDAGQIVPNSYAKSVISSINFRNKTYGLLSGTEQKDPQTLTEQEREILDGGYQEAQSAMAEFGRLGREMNEAQENDDQPRIEELEQEMQDLREKYGSP